MAQEEEGVGALVPRVINMTFTYDQPVPVSVSGEVVYNRANLTKPNGQIGVFLVNGISRHCMQMMQDLRHPNVLRLEAVLVDNENFLDSTCFLQEHKGDVLSYIKSTLQDNREDIIHLLPKILMQLLEVLEYLIDRNTYHGAFSLSNTYYILENDVPVVKISNFLSWDGAQIEWTMNDVWSGDFFRLGQGLDEVVQMMEELRGIPKSYTREIAGLAACLKDRENDPLKMRDLALKQPLFWGPDKRTAIFTHEYPRWRVDRDFCDMVMKKFSCPSTVWNLDSYYGLLKQVEDYRIKAGYGKYDGTKKMQYLNFVSSSYIHEDMLDPLLDNLCVDEVFRKKHPDLFVNLMKIRDDVKRLKEKQLKEKVKAKKAEVVRQGSTPSIWKY